MKFFRFILLLAVAGCAPVFSRAETVDGVEAVVADKAITFAEVQEYTIPAQKALSVQYAAQPEVFNQKVHGLMSDALEQLVERALILHSYNSGSYNQLPDSYVDQLVQDRIRERFGDRITFIKTLQADGTTVEEFRNQIRDNYIERALRSENISKDVFVSPYKIGAYYAAHTNDFQVGDQVKLRMIVLPKTSPDDTNALELAREIIVKVKDGAKFSDMATVYSQGSQQHQAGDWGWVERSVLRSDLANAAFALDAKQVGPPVNLPDAVYVVYVEDKKPAQVRPLTDVRDQIEKILQVQEQARLEKQWIDGLKKKTFIRYFDS
jgi:peptidyl-prolyl cis-trans isomerase SurA